MGWEGGVSADGERGRDGRRTDGRKEGTTGVGGGGVEWDRGGEIGGGGFLGASVWELRVLEERGRKGWGVTWRWVAGLRCLSGSTGGL